MTMDIHYSDPITYISDCRDDNTQGRLKARVSTHFHGSNVIFVGVESDFEAAINLVDIIDAYEGRPGVILANVAPRHGDAKKWPNGTPFGWFKYKEIHIFTTIDGYTLSLLQKLLREPLEVKIYDIPSVVPHMGLEKDVQNRIINTQFRSFDYLPRLAKALVDGADLPVTDVLKEVKRMPDAACWVDSFGNIKTNLLPEEIDFVVGEQIILRIDSHKQFRLPCYERLKDIPDGYVAATIGSSGLNNQRLIEIMQQGDSAADSLGVKSGILIEKILH